MEPDKDKIMEVIKEFMKIAKYNGELNGYNCRKILFFIYYVGQCIDGKRGRPHLLLDGDDTLDIEGMLLAMSQ